MIIKIKYLLLFLAVVFFVACKNKENQKNLIESNNEFLNKDLQKNNLFGNVKSVNEYSLDSDEIKSDYFSYKEFNEKGILIKEEENFWEHRIKQVTCDSNGFPISATQIITFTNSKQEQQIIHYKYKCDAHGLIIKTWRESDFYKLTSYNEDGFETKTIRFREDTIAIVDSIEYDNKGRVIRILKLFPDTIAPYDQTIYKYYDNFKEETTYSRLPSCLIDSVPPVYREELDEFGNPISFYSVSDDGYSFNLTRKYKYDINNNWIECKTFKNDSLYILTKREITYY